MPCDFFQKRRKHQQTDKTQKFLDTRSSISQSASTCLCSGAPRPVGDLAGAATFLSNRKYRYRPYTQPDVGNCWPCFPLLSSSISCCDLLSKRSNALPELNGPFIHSRFIFCSQVLCLLTVRIGVACSLCAVPKLVILDDVLSRPIDLCKNFGCLCV